MDVSAHHKPTPAQIIRDRRGRIIGRIEQHASTGRLVARNARGLVAGTFDSREGTMREIRGLNVGHGDLLTTLFVP